MKRSTKIITTAVALVLVVGFMVVGIYAATSATAGITASVSWEATQGLRFGVAGWTYYSKEHYELGGNSFSELSNHRMETINIDTTTTNAQASGISRNFNASFIDDTDDGVNNPRPLYYMWCFSKNRNYEEFSGTKIVTCTLTKYPTSTSQIKVEWVSTSYGGDSGNDYSEFFTSADEENWSTTPPSEIGFLDAAAMGGRLVMKLTVLTPDASISNFDASVSFSFS